MTSILFAKNVQLEKAKYYCQLSSKNAQLKAYNLYKSVYIKSLIDNNKKEKIEALKGLIECSKKLHLKSDDYERELSYLIGGKKSLYKPKLAKNKTTTQHSTLTSYRLKSGYVQFFFNRPIDKKDIRHFTLKRGSIYKDIYDIKARLGFKKIIKKLHTVDKMKIAQYKKDVVRIVFENSSAIRSRFSLKNRLLNIYLKKNSSTSVSKKSPDTIRVIPQVIKNSSYTIVIDPGHGGKDSGAIGYKRKKEKDIVLSIAKKVYKSLKNAGYKVYLTRRGDYFISLRNRTKFANKVHANLFISIHANAAPKRSRYLTMHGLETFYLSPARSSRAKRIAALENRVDMQGMNYYSKNVYLDFLNREKTILSNKLAIDIQKNILYHLRKRYKVKDGGVRPGPFWVLVGAQMPSILIEVGYITNPTEAMRLSNPIYQKLIAKGVVEGVESYLKNIEK
ncbi:N-acetylmuramoyl-L-alanine amidase family protein [Nitratiruptor sp. SB155-2]|uniref:N-acetylmuramoyl-L-alanine amidase family protein n=1 Tax=Nitratiruptor sp. (strain SB155-2) TaxID=387092 RepID=UPI0001587383|nr:N-acetylmuramoyl-L-alanine amidase [Nitratiruptor sp. SB155-2]BAF69875.1 N-acetylmuramoyl-L-alanine amidase [Nitratiruptor sp. SB155-2]